MEVILVGLGPGGQGEWTEQAAQAIRQADAVMGAPRMLEHLPEESRGELFFEYLPEKVMELLEAHPHWKTACILFGGDIGFYSGAKQLLPMLAEYKTRLVPGVSSPQVLAAKTARCWQDFKLVSAHGKNCDPVAEVLNHKQVFFLTGKNMTPGMICARLNQAGLGEGTAIVGENLSYADEKITQVKVSQAAAMEFAPLSVLLVENRLTFRRKAMSSGIPDECFIRGKVPMTKREVRAVVLALLEPEPEDILYDVGAGTGSVAVEMGLHARRGQVYALEENSQAVELIEANRKEFGTYNVCVVPGRAPETMEDLPAPHAVFIGGSKGNMKAILEMVKEKNPLVRVVVSAITIETLQEGTRLLGEMGYEDVAVCQVSVSRAQKTGRYHMFGALNPIFLISGKGQDNGEKSTGYDSRSVQRGR